MTNTDSVDTNVKVIKLQDEPRVPIIVTNPLVGSGTLIRLSELGILPVVGALVLKHEQIGKHLAFVEAKLRACNDVEAVEFARYCQSQGKDFPTELRKVAGRLETQKAQLRSGLRVIEELMLRHEPSLAESMRARVYAPEGLVTLVPHRTVHRDSEIEARDKFIAAHGRHTGIDICRQLDLQFQARSEEPTRSLPENLVEDYGVTTFSEGYEHKECRGCVQTLISKAKRKYSTYLRG